MNKETLTLKERWAELKQQNPHLRIRNAATELNVSEAELLATQIGETVTRLNTNLVELLSEIEQLGKVMALTRNNECVHERKGVYSNPDFSSPHAGLFVNPDIDLRIFLSHWTKAYAVVEMAGDKERKSLQFFGKDGEAIHKIYLTPQSDDSAFDALVKKYRSDNQDSHEPTEAYQVNLDEKLDEEIDVKTFQQEWKELKDTHNFFSLLKKHHLTRTQALRLAPDEFHAKQISKESIITMLEKAAEMQTPIMVFVGNRGNIQIHTGEVKRLMWHQNWYNVLDPDFNMHLDMDKIAQTWIVRKPTEDGIVTAIEVFNEMGEIIVQFFGKRKPGIPELQAWRDIVEPLS
ncbi:MULTISPECIES: hemin-degrading factor [Myroides]|uniref:Hemin-degrading factor n=1 Tax=Myroides albus TaxID=2562892 RepID=A0A6I3LNX6_9FLAO|nr:MULTISPECIES: ChuX/HutX family heme-like substrate-binding protein [Myroides]MTG97882.1 hemin-degrading factor [Myroides albus]MVX35282.1 hemin-degrading factor [Myroides sp. LoEW2-1]UVD81069.1 hemin-degrading factor [Myroides albus]